MRNTGGANATASDAAAKDFGVVEVAEWRDIFEGPDPAAAFWDETSECLSQFADMFDIADKDAEEYVSPAMTPQPPAQPTAMVPMSSASCLRILCWPHRIHPMSARVDCCSPVP